MKAVVFDGPHKVSVQDRPIPKRETPPIPYPMSSWHSLSPRQETYSSLPPVVPLSTTLNPTQMDMR